MVFNAAGTTQANVLSKYGGVIYAYTEKEVLLWRPTNGPVVYIGDRWGNGNSNQIANTAHVIIRVYHLREAELSKCPYPETVGNATFYVSGLRYGDYWRVLFIHVNPESKQQTKGSYEDIEEVLNNIRVQRKDTSAYRRSLISVKDKRLSSKVIVISHNLREYPVKVDVQVKINEGGLDYIFSGLGSSQRDDDLFKDYGGVIYKYNDQHIELSFPYLENNADTGGLVYTETVNYKEITHELGYYPDLLTVQTLLSDGYMSDGVGGGVFLAADGYKLGNFKSGDVKILAWNIQCSQQVFYKAFEVGDIDHDDKINFPCSYDWTNFLVSVQYKVHDESSPNGGMVFKAAGTTQANDLSKYGGVIYAYTEKEVLLWRPTNGPVFYIGDRWGNGNSNQIANTARVIIRVYHLREADNSECLYPETVGNATFNVSGLRYGDSIVYTCKSGYSHGSGDLTRICCRNGQWSGIVPTCKESKQQTKGSYEDIEEVLNNIRVQRKDTSAYRRSLISVKDERLSSKDKLQRI
ncbi:CSMD [Mytilus edulis]|uniref:CSMD n=1 Tax=Mytilus edulis TaxID=6550 RepID=A0A8S3REJ1_MYTED|nr:CSMD [Mytilus edulis]